MMAKFMSDYKPDLVIIVSFHKSRCQKYVSTTKQTTRKRIHETIGII